MTTHTVESTPDTVRSGYLDPAAKPVAVIPKDVFPADIRDRVAAWLRPGQARP
jgi:hypothetical protein